MNSPARSNTCDMSSADTVKPTLFADEVAAYNDTELDLYLEKNGRLVDVEDPENLPNGFIQRSRDRVHRLNELVQSRPVDLDQVTARLENIPPDRERASPCPSEISTASSEPEEETHRKTLLVETACYHTLIREGGRPSHMLSQIEDIIENPGESREILSFWQGNFANEKEWEVFSIQLVRWHDFQRLQRFARGQSAYDYWRSEWEQTQEIRRLSAGPTSRFLVCRDPWEPYWQDKEKRFGDRRVIYVSGQYRLWEQFLEREGCIPKQQGFSEYAEALKERLTRHGFTRVFQLDQNLAQQDKLTTWIEYLGYQYWWYDQLLHPVRRRQPRRDDAWKKLVDSGVLKAYETEDILHNIDKIFQRSCREDRAEKAFHSAKSAVFYAEREIENPGSEVSAPELRQQLMAARSKLDRRQKKWESIKRRNDCISEFIKKTKNYWIAKLNAEHHNKLLRWILQQLPLVELGLHPEDRISDLTHQKEPGDTPKRLGDHNQSSQIQGRDEDGSRSTHLTSAPHNGQKRKRSHDIENEVSSFKRCKNSTPHPHPSDCMDADSSDSTAASWIPEVSFNVKRDGGWKNMKRKASVDESSRIVKRLRRTTSATEREHASAVSLTPPQDTIQHAGQESTRSAQVPTPPSSTEGEKPEIDLGDQDKEKLEANG